MTDMERSTYGALAGVSVIVLLLVLLPGLRARFSTVPGERPGEQASRRRQGWHDTGRHCLQLAVFLGVFCLIDLWLSKPEQRIEVLWPAVATFLLAMLGSVLRSDRSTAP